MVYNILKDDTQEAIDLSTRNNVDIVKVNITIKDLPELYEIVPVKCKEIEDLLKMKQFKDGITSMALPLNETLPTWILDYVDYTEVINANMKIFPLDQIGIDTIGKDSINYTNIL